MILLKNYYCYVAVFVGFILSCHGINKKSGCKVIALHTYNMKLLKSKIINNLIIHGNNSGEMNESYFCNFQVPKWAHIVFLV